MIVEAIVLGLVQGLSEFLPISSTAHIRIVPALLGWEDPGAPFTAAIQLGTLVAIVAYFWKDLTQAARGWFQSLGDREKRDTPEARMGWAVLVGTIPIVVLGFLFRDQIENQLRSMHVIAWALIIVGITMGIADRLGPKTRSSREVRWTDGVVVGLCQAVALIPGASRSGSTITGALFLGFDRAEAARFSFLLSIPSILAAGIFSIWSHRDVLLGPDQTAVWVANAVSLVSGYLSIALLLKLLARYGTAMFVVYRILLGGAILVAMQAGW